MESVGFDPDKDHRQMADPCCEQRRSSGTTSLRVVDLDVRPKQHNGIFPGIASMISLSKDNTRPEELRFRVRVHALSGL